MKLNRLFILSTLLVSCLLCSCKNKKASSLSELENSSSPQNTTIPNPEDLTSYSISLNYSMSGKVSNATISLKNNQDEIVSSGKANENGTYIASLPKGEYKVEVSDMDQHYYLDNEDIHIVDTEPSIDVLVRSKILSEETYQIGDQMYDYCFEEAESKQKIYLSDVLKQEKNKFVVINFWYVSCKPCENEFKALGPTYELYKDKMEVIALSYDINSKIYKYKDTHELTFLMGNDPSNELIKASGLEYFPTTMFVEKSGRLDYILSTGLDKQEDWVKVFDHYLSKDYVPNTFPSPINLN